jgi:CRP/FNR family transcriptional regulator, cyclic AMP receptor protein
MNADEEAGNRELAGAEPSSPQATAGQGFWGQLSQPEQAALRALGQVTAFRAGESICVEGEQATDVLVLTAGWVKVLSVSRGHREMILALRGNGEIVGELAGNSEGYRTATVVAVDPVSALAVTHDTFSRFLDSHPGADRAYRRTLTQRWREAADMLRSRSVNNGAQRLAGLLLDLAARHGTSDGPATVITMPLSQEEIASLAGTSRATITRALAEWRTRGLISTARHQITIHSAPDLRGLAGRNPEGTSRLAVA